MLVYKPELYVPNGERLFDSSAPSWYGRIDLNKLDMRNAKFCMLGQIDGSFHRGMSIHQLGADPQTAAHYGFTVPLEFWGPNVSHEFALLTNFWKQRVRARLNRVSAA